MSSFGAGPGSSRKKHRPGKDLLDLAQLFAQLAEARAADVTARTPMLATTTSACYSTNMDVRGLRYLVDEDGQEVGVVLTMDTYRELLAELEELESLRAFDAAKAERGADAEAVDLAEALEEIERARH